MGWRIDWVSSGGSDFNRDLGFLHTEEELKPFLEGEIPLTVEQNARMCGTDAGGLRRRGAGPERLRAVGRHGLPDLRDEPRGLEPAMAYYGLFDLTPKGRDESATEPCGSAATTSTSRPRKRQPAHNAVPGRPQAPRSDRRRPRSCVLPGWEGR